MSDDIRPELHKIGYGQAITPSLPPIAAAPSDTPHPAPAESQSLPVITRVHAEVAELAMDYVAFAFEHGYHEDGISSPEVLRENAAVLRSLADKSYVLVSRKEWDELQAAHEQTQSNASFIAHARTDVPELLSAVASLRSENEALRKVVEAAISWDEQIDFDPAGEIEDALVAAIAEYRAELRRIQDSGEPAE